WLSIINSRLKLDKLTNPSRYGKKVLKEDLVLRTWSSTFMKEENLPGNWIKQSGVLVGIARHRPPWRN
ncbi:hypothetical protein M405DRAFT_714211, partial [Rhizopogon salebrosus TDB-379]